MLLLDQKWYWISLSYATFGIRTVKNRIDTTAPIGKWMKGKHIDYIKKWVQNKNGMIKRIC